MTDTAVGPPGVPPAGRRRRRPLTFGRVTFFLVFLGLPLAIYATLVLKPFTEAFYYSLTDWRGFSPEMNFVGLDNYVRIFSDDTFRRSMRNNAILVVVVPFVTIVLSLALASVLTVSGRSSGEITGLRGSSFYRVISFFPYAVPAIIVGLIFGMVYNPRGGLLNGLLTSLGLDAFDSFPWLGDTRTAMAAVIFVMVWAGVGFYMILFVAAIKGVDKEVYEAARLDGAGRFRTATRITIPLIRENVQTAYIYLGIGALDAFVFMQAMVANGGPDNSTLVMTQTLFRTAFTQNKWGEASAMGVVLALITLAFSALVFVLNRLTGGDKEGSQR